MSRPRGITRIDGSSLLLLMRDSSGTVVMHISIAPADFRDWMVDALWAMLNRLDPPAAQTEGADVAEWRAERPDVADAEPADDADLRDGDEWKIGTIYDPRRRDR